MCFPGRVPNPAGLAGALPAGKRPAKALGTCLEPPSHEAGTCLPCLKAGQVIRVLGKPSPVLGSGLWCRLAPTFPGRSQLRGGVGRNA